MERLFLFQKSGRKMGYSCPKNMCYREGIDFKKIPEDVKKGKIGFTVGDIAVSIIEVDTRVKL